jgi:hypothetical protein
MMDTPELKPCLVQNPVTPNQMNHCSLYSRTFSQHLPTNVSHGHQQSHVIIDNHNGKLKDHVNGRMRNEEEVSIHVDEEEATDEYFKTATRGLMLEQLSEFYNFYEHNKVPIEWNDTFEQDTQLGNGSKLISAYAHRFS